MFFSRYALADNYFLFIGAVKEAYKVLQTEVLVEILPLSTRCHAGHPHPVKEKYHLDGNPNLGVLLSTFSLDPLPVPQIKRLSTPMKIAAQSSASPPRG